MVVYIYIYIYIYIAGHTVSKRDLSDVEMFRSYGSILRGSFLLFDLKKSLDASIYQSMLAVIGHSLIGTRIHTHAYTHTHTHIQAHRERERDRKRASETFLCIIG